MNKQRVASLEKENRHLCGGGPSHSCSARHFGLCFEDEKECVLRQEKTYAISLPCAKEVKT